MDSGIFGTQNLSFGRPGASILAPWIHFGTLGHHGGPWEQQEGHVGVWNRIFIDFGTIWGAHFDSFLSTEG